MERLRFERDFGYKTRRILSTVWIWTAKEGEGSSRILRFLAWDTERQWDCNQRSREREVQPVCPDDGKRTKGR